jgi:hypothetical protein
MIKLPILVTTQQEMLDGKVVNTLVTDTLFVSEVRIDFTTGALYATIQRGTGSPFVSNYPALHVVVNPDGSFVSDGPFSGNAGDIPAIAIVQSLSGQFDQFVGGILAIYAKQAQAA